MRLNKLIITGEEAHFKIPMRSKFQSTYKIPPISTVVGILKNIYGENIDDFKVGYFIEYESVGKEIVTIYKEVNISIGDSTPKGRFTKDIIYVENMHNVRLVIYHDISESIKFKEPLTLGKANYLANVDFSEVELTKECGYGYNQYTPVNIGAGNIVRINTLTKYSDIKGYYEYKQALVRESLEEFELECNHDKDEDINIFIWNWRDGNVD